MGAIRLLPIACVSWLALSVSVASGNDASPSQLRYGPKGLEYETGDGHTSLWIGLRFQLRYTEQVHSNVPGTDGNGDRSLNRGRIKGGGHVVRPWLDVYAEYDVVDDRILDYRMTLKMKDWAQLRAGQWKSEFSRERIDSSGKQQFVDRSIANYWFTVDRQLGVALSGRVAPGQNVDSSYWAGILSANGRGGDWDGDDYMLLARYQWNPLGRVLPFSQCDLEQRDHPALAITLAGIYGYSAYTRFSSSGGGHLPEYDDGPDGRYRIRQFLLESAFQGHGFSYQQELHWKEIEDRSQATVRHFSGGYVQAGYFLHQALPAIPAPLEVAARFGMVNPDLSDSKKREREYALAANWFFKGHRNKVTADISYWELAQPDEASYQTLFRLQWDVSL